MTATTPFTFINEFGRFNAASNTDGAVRPTASFAASQVTNYSANTLIQIVIQAFVFQADYFTELETDWQLNRLGSKWFTFWFQYIYYCE